MTDKLKGWRMLLSLVLLVAGLALGGTGVSQVYSQTCSNFNCLEWQGSCMLNWNSEDCQDWCNYPYKCRIVQGKCSSSTEENPYHCAQRSCVSEGLCPPAQP